MNNSIRWKSPYHDASKERLEQVIEDKKQLIYFLEEELDCCGVVEGEVYETLERTIADLRSELILLRLQMKELNTDGKEGPQ